MTTTQTHQTRTRRRLMMRADMVRAGDQVVLAGHGVHSVREWEMPARDTMVLLLEDGSVSRVQLPAGHVVEVYR